MLELGSSKSWPDAMEKITQQRQMDPAGLLEYFQPLIDWLTEENKRTNEYIGWIPSTKSTYCNDILGKNLRDFNINRKKYSAQCNVTVH